MTDVHPDDLDPVELALVDLGAHLDLRPGPTGPTGPALSALVLARVPEQHATTAAPRRRASLALVGVAAAAAVLVALVAVEPARTAVAGWLGIGAVEVTQAPAPGPGPAAPPASSHHPSATTAPTSVGTVVPLGPNPAPFGPDQLAAAQAALPFPIHLPSSAVAGAPRTIAVDHAVGTGLVEVAYPTFTLVELASRPDAEPIMSKTVGPGTRILDVRVGTRPALWLDGQPHQLSFVRPDGTYDTDRTRQAGSVLLWEDGGISHRIEGLDSLDAALDVAATMP